MAKRSLRDIFVRKSVEQMHAEHEHGELKRSLGATNLVLLGIGCIIGTGIFVLTGRAAAQFAGPAIMISFVITGTLCALVALAYAELASAIPVSGSAYSYSYASLGEFAAWIMGVLLVLEYGAAASTVAVGWSGYVASFLHDLGIDIPAALRGAVGTPVTDFVSGEVVGTGVVNLPAVIGCAAVTGLLVLGVSESAFVNNIIVAIKVTVVIAFIIIGAFYVNPALWSPLIPEAVPPPLVEQSIWSEIGTAMWDVLTAKNTGQYGVAGIITAAATIFFAYIGFEAVSTAGAESRNPKRDMPIGILGSLVICTILYILTSAVLVGIVPYTDLNDAAPIAKAVNQHADRRSARVRLRRIHGPRRPRERDERRHIGRVRDRLRHRHLFALCASRHAASVQDAAVSGDASAGSWDESLPADVLDERRGDAELLHSLPHHRRRALLRVRHVEFQAR